MFLQGVSETEAAGLAAIGGAYVLYLLMFCAVTVAASGLFASARASLVVLLGFWAVSTLLVPRVAPAVAESSGAYAIRPRVQSGRHRGGGRMASTVTIRPTSG